MKKKIAKKAISRQQEILSLLPREFQTEQHRKHFKILLKAHGFNEVYRFVWGLRKEIKKIA